MRAQVGLAHALLGVVLGSALVGMSCSGPPRPLGPVHPICQGRADALDCQLALEPALGAVQRELRIDPRNGYDIMVTDTECLPTGCFKFVHGEPRLDTCGPLWDVEVTPVGPHAWRVSQVFGGERATPCVETPAPS
jgi:hypothetical protein